MSTESKVLAVLSHVSYFFLPILVPVVVLLLKTDDPFVKHHAKQALVLHAALVVAAFISWILCIVLIGFLLVPLVGIFGLVVTIIAIIRTIEGEYYRYPVAGNWFN
ncbi:DUF4870 domain-containing protein [Tumebacillus algifaecis]|uniref:DUF4870 domain-containing protein n=1 Tax=Tumebacillus algifaecis TaxID=1214604 RepID=UPI001D13093B|nr:DUF4870 domain-containing protein [Tumebacillus algifaecis]